MSNPKGTRWATAVVEYLLTAGAPAAEKRSLNGARDLGDITGVHPSVMIEAKNRKTINLAQIMGEVETQTQNVQERMQRIGDSYAARGGSWAFRAALGMAFVKRPRKGQVADGYAVMSIGTAVRLLREAGYVSDALANPSLEAVEAKAGEPRG